MLSGWDVKKLNKELNDYVNADSYKSSKGLLLEHTSFNRLHSVGSGRNCAPTLLTLQTVKTEINGVLFEKDGEFYNIYMKAKNNSGHGRDNRFVIRYRKDNKTKSIIVQKNWDTDKVEINTIRYDFGDDLAKLLTTEYKAWLAIERDDLETNVTNIKAAMGVAGAKEDDRDYESEFTVDFYQRLIQDLDTDRDYSLEKLKKVADAAGIEILTVFEFTHEFRFIRPQYVKQTKSYIELGLQPAATYNSLPEVIKISKIKEVKTVGLAEIGVEGPGYYSHDDRMQILPSEVKAAKAFSKKFESSKRSMLNRVKKEVANGY